MASPPLSPRPSTGVRLRDPNAVPLPSSPLSFVPQHLTLPALRSPPPWKSPAPTPAHPPRRPARSTGVDLSVVVPSPSSPSVLEPQHFTAPLTMSAHVCTSSIALAATPPPLRPPAPPLPSPTTSTGAGRLTVVPSPSSPK